MSCYHYSECYITVYDGFCTIESYGQIFNTLNKLCTKVLCISDIQNFQIDFIKITNESWDTARVYYSYDPLGNIMGKAYHKFGLSYGWDGLYYKFRNFNGKYSQDLLISTDPEKIFAFGERQGKKLKVTEEDVYAAIRDRRAGTKTE